MHTCFHGWRRTTGCVTLLMALALMGMWFRSFAIQDICHVSMGDASHTLRSIRGSVRQHRNTTIFGPEWVIKRYAFEMKHHGTLFDQQYADEEFVLPYWPLVVSLTLLSACLILCKPSKRSSDA